MLLGAGRLQDGGHSWHGSHRYHSDRRTHTASRSAELGFSVPLQYHCWINLIYNQIMMPHVSFTGHLCGILAGLVHVFLPKAGKTLDTCTSPPRLSVKLISMCEHNIITSQRLQMVDAGRCLNECAPMATCHLSTESAAYSCRYLPFLFLCSQGTLQQTRQAPNAK